MRDIGRSLADAGFGGVSELVESAVLHFERGNEQLREALERLDDGAAPEGKG
ncbi:MAG: hypothetical protein LBS51_04180 [Oscillospiraceae bacterium]|jgi:hypothetical protein|nr:hypothetical protein [Oscillospiraceae bacterium]